MYMLIYWVAANESLSFNVLPFLFLPSDKLPGYLGLRDATALLP